MRARVHGFVPRLVALLQSALAGHGCAVAWPCPSAWRAGQFRCPAREAQSVWRWGRGEEREREPAMLTRRSSRPSCAGILLDTAIFCLWA